MFEGLKQFIITRKLKKICRGSVDKERNFNNFVFDSKSIFVILPPIYSDQQGINILFDFLLEQGKKITVFSTITTFDQLFHRTKCSFMEYVETDISKLNFPTSAFQNKLKQNSFDIVINLSIKNDPFYFAVANLVNSKNIVGFESKYSNFCSSFQISKKSEDIDELIKTMIDTLKMF